MSSSSSIRKAPTPQEQRAQQKQALKARLTSAMAEQNRKIDSLIAVKDSRLKKDKNGKYIKPNWVSATGTPLYYSNNMRSVRKAIKANSVGVGGNLGFDLNGEGINVGIWDGGHIFVSHDEFTGGTEFSGYQVPIEIADSTAADIISGHPTGVASVIIAKGLLESDNYDIAGVAPQLDKVYSFDWENDILEIFDQLQIKNNTEFILSNHSYGIPLKDPNGILIEDELIGNYSWWSSLIDYIAYEYPSYLHVVAGGNDGNTPYPTQQVTDLDQLTGSTTAKNVLTVGSLSMDRNSENFTPSNFSSAGPTNDFRIKPEIVAPGSALGIAYWNKDNPNSTNEYVIQSGTSFAAPATTGGIALLQQLSNTIHNNYMRSPTVKALLCHTADDIILWKNQDITGPDVKTGYGAINLEKATRLIEDDAQETNTIVELNLDNNEEKTFYFIALEPGELKATLSWLDPFAEENASVALVNDLDLRITRENTTYLPWKLPQNAQQAVAVLGDNTADNLEQVRVAENFGGVYEINVSHKGSLESGSQAYSLIITGNGNIISSKTAFENISDDGFLVFPIPARESFTIAAVNNEMMFRELRLYTISGVEVARTTKRAFSLASTRFDTSSLSSGTYVLAIETQKNTVFKNIIIQ